MNDPAAHARQESGQPEPRVEQDVAPAGIPAGRAVRLVPTPPGLWRVVLGLFAGALAPLFGFLVGGSLGADPDSPTNPMFIGLFVGIVVGGVAVLVAVSGAVRLWRHFHDQALESDDPISVDEPTPAS